MAQTGNSILSSLSQKRSKTVHAHLEQTIECRVENNASHFEVFVGSYRPLWDSNEWPSKMHVCVSVHIHTYTHMHKILHKLQVVHEISKDPKLRIPNLHHLQQSLNVLRLSRISHNETFCRHSGKVCWFAFHRHSINICWFGVLSAIRSWTKSNIFSLIVPPISHPPAVTPGKPITAHLYLFSLQLCFN